MNRTARLATTVALLAALVACGGKSASPAIDPGGVDPGAEDVPVPVDTPVDPGDPGTDDGVAVDPGTDVPVDAGCKADADCEGKVAGLGPCEAAKCDAGACVKGPAKDGTACDDGSACTKDDACAAGVCGGTAVACDDQEACTTDSCDPATGCVHAPIEGPCDDHTACTGNDACKAGVCAGEPVPCDDGNPCTTDGCDPATGCTHLKLDAVECSDGSVCTTGDTCVDGTCTGTHIDCDDQNVCTDDTCDPVDGCRHAAVLGKCTDGKTCTTADKCVEGACQGTLLECDDGNVCTDDACVEGQLCTWTFNQAGCDDLSACRTNDACTGGTCKGTPVACTTPPGNTCEGAVMVSHPRQGLCTGGTCTYGTQRVTCTGGCAAGKCVGNPCEGISCATPPGPCYKAPGTCQDGACTFAYADGAACDDANPCTTQDACETGVCAGAPIVCNAPPPNECLDTKTLRKWTIGGHCDPGTGQCVYTNTPVACEGGCVDGVCLEALGLLQAELDAGGLAGLSGGGRTGACVMPGWYEGTPSMNSPQYRMSAGFEP